MTTATLQYSPDGGKQLATDGAAHTLEQGALKGEDDVFDRLNVSEKATSKVALTASGQVGAAGARVYRGAIVTTALSAAAITIYDGTSASGTVIDVIPASTTAGTKIKPPSNVPCTNGIYASFAGTGTVLFLYD